MLPRLKLSFASPSCFWFFSWCFETSVLIHYWIVTSSHLIMFTVYVDETSEKNSNPPRLTADTFFLRSLIRFICILPGHVNLTFYSYNRTIFDSCCTGRPILLYGRIWNHLLVVLKLHSFGKVSIFYGIDLIATQP